MFLRPVGATLVCIGNRVGQRPREIKGEGDEN